MAKRRQYTPPAFQDLDALQQELSVLSKGELEARLKAATQRIESLGGFSNIDTLREQADSERVVLHLIQVAIDSLPPDPSDR